MEYRFLGVEYDNRLQAVGILKEAFEKFEINISDDAVAYIYNLTNGVVHFKEGLTGVFINIEDTETSDALHDILTNIVVSKILKNKENKQVTIKEEDLKQYENELTTIVKEYVKKEQCRSVSRVVEEKYWELRKRLKSEVARARFSDGHDKLQKQIKAGLKEEDAMDSLMKLFNELVESDIEFLIEEKNNEIEKLKEKIKEKNNEIEKLKEKIKELEQKSE